MKKMMEGVVLFGTARRAILNGYSVAGKTGTAQKVDPATGGYSKTKYVASFIGFAPVNSPAITIAVILDSPVGLHQGGQVCAPVFKHIAEQVLEYMHVAHDADVKNLQRQNLQASAKEDDLADESSDRLSPPLQMAESDAASNPSPQTNSQAKVVGVKAPGGTSLVPSAPGVQRTQSSTGTEIAQASPPAPPPSPAEQAAPQGTVVLDVDSGVIVPSFLGKPLRWAVESAQQSGLEINAIGSGVARQQWPAPGSRLPSGQKITVRFTH
jgi:cell division protein FtsI (penicillin-binding protein 3)